MKKILLTGLRPALFPLFPIFPLLLLLLFPSCKPCDDPTDPECPNYCMDETNPECPNYDPCWDQTEVSAEFEIREGFFLDYPEGWIIYDTDTVSTGLVTFYALEPDAEYEWYLGSEIIRSRSFSRSDFPEGDIQVSLKVSKTPNTDCFPDDDGVDIQNRSFYQKIFCGSLFNGKFQGVLDSAPKDTFEVQFNPCFPRDPFNPTFAYDAIIVGFDPECDTVFASGGGQLGGWSHREILLGEAAVWTTKPSLRLEGLWLLHGDRLDSLTADYSHRTCVGCWTRVQKKFRGKRVY